MTNEESYTLPSNVKQIGSLNDRGQRIYMEDYAISYIEQYANSQKDKEKIAVLVGKKIDIDGENVIFISGVIQGKYTIKRNGMTELTEKSWQYIKSQMNLYFSDLNIVGWTYIQPGFEEYIGENIYSFQKNNAIRGLEVLYIIDPIENISSLYKWNDNKNEGMHEYMLENKIKEAEEAIEAPETDAGAVARAVASKKRSNYKNRIRTSNDSRKMINLLGGVSFVMLMVCFVMGAGLVQNDERLNSLEEKLILLETALNDSSSVFAAQEPTTQSTTLQTTTVTTTQTTTKTPEPKKYVVKEGDTLIKISKNLYGSSANVSKIRELNNIEGSNIVVGEVLLLP